MIPGPQPILNLMEKNEPSRIILFLSAVLWKIWILNYACLLYGWVAGGVWTGDKVSNDRNRCGSIVQTESVYVSQATPTATSQALLATKVRSVTVAGIFLSEIFHVFSFTYHPISYPHLYKLSDLRNTTGVFQSSRQLLGVSQLSWLDGMEDIYKVWSKQFPDMASHFSSPISSCLCLLDLNRPIKLCRAFAHNS